jgi:hypothetical protein
LVGFCFSSSFFSRVREPAREAMSYSSRQQWGHNEEKCVTGAKRRECNVKAKKSRKTTGKTRQVLATRAKKPVLRKR